MDKMITNKKGTTFAAIKLLEQLYKDGKIPDYMLRNIVDEYAGQIDTTSFLCCDSIGPKKEEKKYV